MPRNTLTVITRQQWRVEELEAVVDVHPDMGFDTRAAEDPGVVVWCPGAWAAAATQCHPSLRLASAGENWLNHVDPDLTGRVIRTVHAGAMASGNLISDGPVFAKLPETKHDSFPGKIRTLAELVADTGTLPGDEPVQLQTPAEFSYEVRCWVVDGKVVAYAPYFQDVPRENWAGAVDAALDESACRWLQTALPHLPPVPASVVIDVGWMIRSGCGDARPGWKIIEANAAWSSDWYTPSSLAAVVYAIRASQGDQVTDTRRWRPSPLLMRMSRGLMRR